jgi:hypothetical protein
LAAQACTRTYRAPRRQQIVRMLDDWPTADALLDAYKHIALIA